MSTGQPLSELYTIKPGDTLSAIAQIAYGDQSLWPEIYSANKGVIGNNPNLITVGTQIFILPNPQYAQIYLKTQSCTVTVTSLQVYERPTTKSTVVTAYPLGTVLNFDETIYGEPVDGNSSWAHSTQGNYFWLGGTDRSQ